MNTFTHVLQAEVDALKRRPAGSAVNKTGQAAAEFDALLDQIMKIGTSPLILPLEADEKAALLDRAFKGEL